MNKADEKNSKKVKKDKNTDLVSSLQAQVAELTDSLKRERADALNLRRRFEEEKSSMSSFYKANIVKDLLPVIDNFDRSLNHIPKELTDNEYIKGIKSISRQFEDILAKIGVQKITSVGAEFDPNIHEAVSMEEGKGKKEVVSEEFQSGYILGEQVIRPAMVRVKQQ